LPKRKKNKKIWYPDHLFFEMELYSTDKEMKDYVNKYNIHNGEDFEPDDVLRAFKKWKKARDIAGDKRANGGK